MSIFSKFGNESVSTKSPQVGAPPDVIIEYTYDDLNRLRNASYSSGLDYTYIYDKVGNRTSQTINGISTYYTYDIANQLANVNGVDYIWNDNGSLVNDGLIGVFL